MKNKKSKKANLENKKGVFFLTGLVISLGLVLAAFEWKTNPKLAEADWSTQTIVPEEDVSIPRTKVDEIKPPKPKVEIRFIDIIDNTSDEEDNSDDFNLDPADEDVIDFDNLVFTSIDSGEEPKPVIFDFVPEMPEFPGGELSLLKYLSSHLKYPVIAQENGIQGKVYVSFIINEDGSVSNVNLMRGIDPSLNNEALRVVRLMPEWKPGRQGGVAVKVRYNVPINFELR